MKDNLLPFSNSYFELLDTIKTTVQKQRSQAIQQLTRSLIVLYWEIGKQILESQEREGWGKSVVEQLAKDLVTTQ